MDDDVGEVEDICQGIEFGVHCRSAFPGRRRHASVLDGAAQPDRATSVPPCRSNHAASALSPTQMLAKPCENAPRFRERMLMTFVRGPHPGRGCAHRGRGASGGHDDREPRRPEPRGAAGARPPPRGDGACGGDRVQRRRPAESSVSQFGDDLTAALAGEFGNRPRSSTICSSKASRNAACINDFIIGLHRVRAATPKRACAPATWTERGIQTFHDGVRDARDTASSGGRWRSRLSLTLSSTTTPRRFTKGVALAAIRAGFPPELLGLRLVASGPDDD